MKSGRRPSFPIEFKVRAAALACAPGISVSKLAREHDLNTNRLFRWRRQYRAGEFYAPVESAPALFPVGLVTQNDTPIVELPSPATRFGDTSVSKPIESTIEIRIAGAVVRVEGDVDVIRLRTVLSALRG